LLIAIPASAQAVPPKIPPIDECKRISGLVQLRARLADAIRKEDSKALLAMLAPDVLNNFGGDNGPARFAEQWGLDGGPSELWIILRPLARMGCARSGDAFVIPSLPVQWDEMEDPYDKYVAVGPKAEVRQGPEYDSPVIATLAWDVVSAIDNASDVQTGVRLADGRTGWMSDTDLYSPLDFRMVIEKRGAKRLITALVAGD
jgi:hypothetical protein